MALVNLSLVFLSALFVWTGRSLAEPRSVHAPTYLPGSVSEDIADRQRAELMEMKSGDILQFSNGRQFVVDRVLGAGTSTVVFSIFNPKTNEPDRDRALRVASDTNSIRLMKSFLDGYAPLKKAGIPIVEILEVGRAPGAEVFGVEYLVVERISDSRDRISIGEFLNRHAGWKNSWSRFSDEFQMEMRQALIKFVVAAKDFQTIGDFAFNQIGYDRRRKSWVLFDWTNQHSYYPTAPDEPSRFIREIESRMYYDLDLNPSRNTAVSRYADDLLKDMIRFSSQSRPSMQTIRECSALFQ